MKFCLIFKNQTIGTKWHNRLWYMASFSICSHDCNAEECTLYES